MEEYEMLFAKLGSSPREHCVSRACPETRVP